MKKMKKAVALLCLAAVGASAFAFTGCKKDEAGKVMNVALNPEVEFVLDANDKVVTVNALNEEGNLVISAAAFENVEGKTAEEAAKLFVQVSEETGFLLEGNVGAGENELKISFSGDKSEAKKLYNDVKAEVEAYVATLSEQITVGITQAAAITEEALKTLVAEVAPYLDVAKMEYAELIAELEASRKETAEYYSQELKNAYYDAKAYAYQKAELSVLKEKAGALASIAIGTVEALYDGAMNALNAAREALLDENGIYQRALASFRAKKVEFLNYKNYVNSLETATQEQLDRLTSIENALNGFETTMASAVSGIDALQTSVTNAYNKIIEEIEKLSIRVSQHLDEISTATTAALDSFTTEFETTYATHKAHAQQAWGDMRTALEAGYQEESAE